ncbi:MAG: hypothetical protein GY838_19630 [bacterium]|nr:hypothetical protein [bacterium]
MVASFMYHISFLITVGAIMLGSTSTVQAGEEFRESIRGFEVLAGAVSSDFGGQRDSGVAIGLRGPAKALSSSVLIRIGAEYARKVNTGHVSKFDIGSGTTEYAGQGTVSLDYIQVLAELVVRKSAGSFDLRPYIGLGPAMLVDQSVSTDEPSGDAFGAFKAYSQFDALAVVGVSVGYNGFMLDLQFAQGLLDPVWSGDGLLPGQSSGGSSFTSQGDRSQSARLAGGVSF